MSEVIGLGYLGFGARDIEAWRTWATEVLGLQVATPPPGASDDHLFLRMDERGWRFAIEPSDVGALHYTGWEVASPADLDQLEERLTGAGIVVKRDDALARTRQVEGLIRCADPDGYSLEFFCGAFVPADTFVSPRGVRFVTGDLGLGHILSTVSDEDATKHFYLDLLGFRLSDIIEFGSNRVHFTRVNPRHHSFAFAAVSDRPPSLGHFMLEVDGIDAVGCALDLVNSGMGELTETLGRHTNDHMISFYMRNPSESQTEYGYSGRLVDEATWTISTYHATAFWGHKVPGSEYLAAGATSPRATGDLY